MISESYFWLNILLLGIGTYAIRGSFVALSSRMQITTRMKELFSFIPAAILPAFVAPAVFFHNGTAAWAFQKERFVIVIAATAVCYFTRSTLITILFGLVALYVATQIY